MDTPTPTYSAIANPTTFHPALAASEWVTLKEARGQTVDLDRIASPHHLIEQHGTSEALTCRVITRVHAHIARTGITGPAPLIA